jgi:hypothetical protein
LAQAAKEQAFLDAQSNKQYLEMIVEDTRASLKYFEEDQAAGDDEIIPCEPKFLYELDPATMLPQMSFTAIDLINAYISGEIDPAYVDEIDPARFGLDRKQIRKVFGDHGIQTPGFDQIDIPHPHGYEEEAAIEDPNEKFNKFEEHKNE